MKIERAARDGESMMVPRYGEGRSRVVVDPAWGEIQPLEAAPGVATVAEPDVITHIKAGLPLVDTRHDEHRAQATIPTSRGIPHEEIVERLDELDPQSVTILFCNGPQCKATPDAIRKLIDSGFPPAALRYYRGGIHDWMTLGLPVEGSRRSTG